MKSEPSNEKGNVEFEYFVAEISLSFTYIVDIAVVIVFFLVKSKIRRNPTSGNPYPAGTR